MVDATQLLNRMMQRYELDGEAVSALNRFVDLVRTASELPEKWNRTAQFLAADSLCALEVDAVQTATTMADFGSGAGFPGMVVAIVRPDARIALIEEKAERCDFMVRAAASLGLEHVEVVQASAADWREAADAPRDVVVVRNYARVWDFMPWARSNLRPGGSLVVWRGPNADWGNDDEARIAADNGMRFVRSIELHWIRANRWMVHYERPPDD
jgi:16S rRNA (guanine(527)-N(7))-methyltransferase RsmG